MWAFEGIIILKRSVIPRCWQFILNTFKGGIVNISSRERGIHFNSIKAASEIVAAISKVNGGEANFRFTTSANCPAGIPFFPAAFHEGRNSFAVGLESANLLTDTFKRDKNPPPQGKL